MAGKRRKREARGAQAPLARADARTYRGFTLNTFQEEAVAAIDARRSVLVSAPTGAGKTLIAEYAVERALQHGATAVYTAPIKALSNQKFRDFRALFGDKVGIMTGDVTLNPGAPLVIMTTEIFRNTIFEGNIDLARLEYVVFDEIHYMDDLERGTVWEESIIFAPEHIRFVCLSATISNLGEFGRWLGLVRGEDVAVIKSTDRPVPLTHYVFIPGHGPTRADQVRSFPRRPRSGHGRIGREQLLDRLEREDKLPILYFCFSRGECEKRARENRFRHLLGDEEQERIGKLFAEICCLYNLKPEATLEELHNLALEGIGYHHAGLLPQHKELVERLFTSGLLKLLFTTETFALGINMPARTAIFSSLRKFDGVGFDTLMAREYQQMAGRAGRQGIDPDGLVYAIIDDRRVAVEDVRRLLSNDVEPIRSRFNLSYSTLINLRARLKDEIFTAWEKSFNNFQWTRMSRKKRDRNRAKQLDLISRKLAFLEQLEYVKDDGPTERGKVAALINGYEIQTAELLFSGLLDELDEVQVNVVLSSLVFEGRRNDLYRRMDRGVLGGHRERLETLMRNVIELEKSLGIRATLKDFDFRIGSVTAAWCRGRSFTDLEEYTNASKGDLVRTFRLTIQLIRQIRKAMPPNPELKRKLSICAEILNRDEVDAQRQLQV